VAPRGTPSILLVYPSCFYYPGWVGRVELKTSLVWLASYLRPHYPVTFADFEIEIGRAGSPVQIRRYERKVREYLSSQRFDILALSCWTSLSYQATLTVARIAREINPDAVIVVGGYHPSARPHDFIREDRLIDYVVSREGELALKEIADGWAITGRPPKTTMVTGKTVTAEQFVGYDWDLVETFVKRNFPEGIDNFYIYLSRGCPFGCSFCMEPAKDRSWRAYTPQEAVRQINLAVERLGVFAVAASDACFGMRPAWRKEFLRRMKDVNPKIWLVFETRPEYLDAEDIELLAGRPTEIQFGVESGSPDILQIMKKTRQPEQFLDRFAQVSDMLSDRGIFHRANLIFNHPGETRRTLGETMAFMDRMLARNESYLMWAMHGFMDFPGCDIDTSRAEYERKYGCKFLAGDWWKGDTDQYDASLKFVPSADLDGENLELWQKLTKERDRRMRDTLADEAFQFAAKKYFWEWRDDPRFKND
jgi:anaerobic magnesium-protoporphyrin IX monomethyl ester cyclase